MKDIIRLKNEGKYLEALKALGNKIIDKFKKGDNDKLNILSAIGGVTSNEAAEEVLEDFIEKFNIVEDTK